VAIPIFQDVQENCRTLQNVYREMYWLCSLFFNCVVMYLRIFGKIKLNSGLFLLKYLRSISLKLFIFNSYISIHSRSFHEASFVGNPSFNTNSLRAWVTAYLSGPKVPMKLRSCNHPVIQYERRSESSGWLQWRPTWSKKKWFGNDQQRSLPKH